MRFLGTPVYILPVMHKGSNISPSSLTLAIFLNIITSLWF
jgi:hypothetical protein